MEIKNLNDINFYSTLKAKEKCAVFFLSDLTNASNQTVFILKNLSGQYAMDFFMIDIDLCAVTVENEKIEIIPTCVVYSSGKELKRFERFLTIEEIEKILNDENVQ